jgi:hypothetical protein
VGWWSRATPTTCDCRLLTPLNANRTAAELNEHEIHDNEKTRHRIRIKGSEVQLEPQSKAALGSNDKVNQQNALDGEWLERSR